jgi:predicted DNA-binding transcriptional regulator AlpA
VGNYPGPIPTPPACLREEASRYFAVLLTRTGLRSRREHEMLTLEFFLPSEVQEITRLRDPTRKRMEKRGLFPARIHIAPRRIAWRRTDIQASVGDPKGWAKRRTPGGGA